MATPGIFKVQNVSGAPFPFEGFGLEGSIILTVIFVIIILLPLGFQFPRTSVRGSAETLIPGGKS
jgi:hypothetical protein